MRLRTNQEGGYINYAVSPEFMKDAAGRRSERSSAAA